MQPSTSGSTAFNGPPIFRPHIPAHISAYSETITSDEREIGRYNFEGGQHIRIVATHDLDTEEALDMAETIITLKRRELERKKRATSSERNDDISGEKNDG